MNAKPVRFWVVDDDINEHLLLAYAFRHSATANSVQFFLSAADACQALESATSPEQLPHVILCDIKMPCMGGFEFLEWLRHSRWQTMPMALFSNSNIQSDIDRCYAMGGNAFHVKSTSAEQLRHCVDIIIMFWSEVVRLPSPILPCA